MAWLPLVKSSLVDQAWFQEPTEDDSDLVAHFEDARAHKLRELRTCSSATFVGDGQFDQPQLNGEQEEEEEDGEEEEEEEDSSELEDAAVETERKEEADDDDEEEVEVNDDEEADDDQAYALFSAGYFADSGDRSPPLQDDAGVHQLGAGSGDRADADSSSANIREQQSMSPLDDEDEEARTLGL